MVKKLDATIIMLFLVLTIFIGCVEEKIEEQKNLEDFQTILDMRGEEVLVPKNISRVIDISDGFIASVMQSFDIEEKIVGLGSTNLQEIDSYTFKDASGENYSYEEGMNPVTYLNPALLDLPAVAEYDVAVNLETIASLEPDVVFIRVGFCSMNTDEYGTDEDIQTSIEQIEALDIPVVVLYGPPVFSSPDISLVSEEIEIIGDVFNMTEEAEELNEYIESIIELIVERTQNVTEKEKPTVLLFGLSPEVRKAGTGAGDVLCTDTMESYFIEEIVNAKNAINHTGGWQIYSAEQILKLNPDVIVLPTDWGYHPPRELYNSSYYSTLQELDAVKNRRVWALPWTPYNCAKRLEYPIEVMVIAKAAYPERFSDFKINEWVLDFYKTVYHVDNETAEQLRTIQWLDWTVEEDV